MLCSRLCCRNRDTRSNAHYDAALASERRPPEKVGSGSFHLELPRDQRQALREAQQSAADSNQARGVDQNGPGGAYDDRAYLDHAPLRDSSRMGAHGMGVGGGTYYDDSRQDPAAFLQQPGGREPRALPPVPLSRVHQQEALYPPFEQKSMQVRMLDAQAHSAPGRSHPPPPDTRLVDAQGRETGGWGGVPEGAFNWRSDEVPNPLAAAAAYGEGVIASPSAKSSARLLSRAPDIALPPGWTMQESTRYAGAVYYVAPDGASQWHPPPDGGAQEGFRAIGLRARAATPLSSPTANKRSSRLAPVTADEVVRVNAFYKQQEAAQAIYE